jgi:hypothetical protein
MQIIISCEIWCLPVDEDLYCGLVDCDTVCPVVGYQSFGLIYCPTSTSFLPWRWRQQVTCKCWYLSEYTIQSNILKLYRIFRKRRNQYWKMYDTKTLKYGRLINKFQKHLHDWQITEYNRIRTTEPADVYFYMDIEIILY